MASLGEMMSALNRLGDSELGQRLNLHERAQRILRDGAKGGLLAAGRAAEQLKPMLERLRQQRPAREASTGAGRFDVTPSEEQQMLRDTLRRLAEEAMRPVAEQADAESRVPEEFLELVHELGIAAMPIPEALGGAGEARSPVTTAIVAEELSRGDMGLAYAALSPAAVAHALLDYGTEAQRRAHLPRFTGDKLAAAAFALAEPTPAFDSLELETRAKKAGAEYVLRGTKTVVPMGERAELFLVAAAIDGRHPALFLVERGAQGLSIAPEPTMGLRSAAPCRLVLEDVRVPRDALLGGAPDAVDYGAVVANARVAWGAMAVGAAQAMLDYAIPYCNDRQAFGEPVSHRQSVAFMIADMALELEGMRLLVWRAASRAEAHKPFRREAYLARLHCADKGMKIGTDGVQLLGGHGFVKDHPVEMWYRHLRGVGVMEGGLLL